MNKIIRKVTSLLGFYKPGVIHKVKLRDIVIPIEFQNTKPRFRKMVYKREFFRKNGYFESKIILNKDFMLIDGYTSYIIAEENGMEYVDVYFVD